MDESLIWQIYEGLGKQCPHFNSLETHYPAAIVAIALWYISLIYLAAAALFVIAGVGVSAWMYRASTPRRG